MSNFLITVIIIVCIILLVFFKADLFPVIVGGTLVCLLVAGNNKRKG
jgi:hypothetical protein